MLIEFPDKLYYSIGEVAKAFNVNTSLIRYWEKEFDIISPKKNRKGNRYFTKTDIENLKTIFYLVKEKGYTLEGAKIALEDKHKIDKHISIISRLEFIKSKLNEIKRSLDVDED